MTLWRWFTRVVMWTLHAVSWVLALYLFATGKFWGGMGCILVSVVMWLALAFIVAVVWQTQEFQEGIEEAKKKARQKAYEDELRKRSAEE